MNDAQVLQRLVGSLDYPMVIVTAASDGQRAGCLVGFVTQCSIHPPRFLVCVSQRNATHEVALRSPVLAMHYLDDDDIELAELFGEQTGDHVDKFEQCSWDSGPSDVPVLRDCAGYVAGRVLRFDDAGDHTAFLIEPVAAEQRRELRPLGFQAVKDMEPGHEA